MKNDHRVRLTKLLLRQSFMTLLAEKPVSKITVKELCEASGINRATFYAHYADVFDLRDAIKDELAQELMELFTRVEEPSGLRDILLPICRSISNCRDACETIFGKNGDLDMIQDMVDSVKRLCIALWHSTGADEEIMRLHFAFGTYGALAVVRTWVQGGYRQSPEVIAAIIEANTVNLPLNKP